MGSVVMLPEPADKVVLIRTPPDYVFIQLYSLCIVVPSTCCLLCYACCCVDQGSNGHRSCGAAYTCSLLCTAGLVTPVVLLVMLAYLDMGNLFFIDWNFKVSIDLSFVGMAMIAKCFLGAVAVLDSIVYIISLIQDACWLEEKKTQVERFSQKYEVETRSRSRSRRDIVPSVSSLALLDVAGMRVDRFEAYCMVYYTVVLRTIQGAPYILETA